MSQPKVDGGAGKRHALLHDDSVVRIGLNDESNLASLAFLENLTQEGIRWRESITEDELDAIERYQISSHEYVNAHLRGLDHDYPEQTEEAIALLDSAIAKAVAFPTERLLYRSIILPEAFRVSDSREEDLMKWLESNFVEGSEIVLPEFVSTTADSDLIVRIGQKKRKQGYQAALEIVSKSGAVLHKPARKGSWSIQDDEKEVLLPRGKKFRVEKVYREVTFESSYAHGVDNSNKGFYPNWYTQSEEPIRTIVPVVQLVEVS